MTVDIMAQRGGHEECYKAIVAFFDASDVEATTSFQQSSPAHPAATDADRPPGSFRCLIVLSANSVFLVNHDSYSVYRKFRASA